MQTKKHRKTQSKRNKKVIGKLYATWCGHCKTLEPEWKKMKTSVTKIYKNGVEFVEIESENMEQGLADLKKRLNINIGLQGGYPTLFKVEPGAKKVEYYGGQREAGAMSQWCKGTNSSLTKGEAWRLIPPSHRTTNGVKTGGKRKTKSKRTLKH